MRHLEPTFMLGECSAPLGDSPDLSTSCLTELIQAEISPSQCQESTCGLPSTWTPFQCSQAGFVRDTLGWPDSGKEPGRGLWKSPCPEGWKTYDGPGQGPPIWATKEGGGHREAG